MRTCKTKVGIKILRVVKTEYKLFSELSILNELLMTLYSWNALLIEPGCVCIIFSWNTPEKFAN